MSYYKLAVFIKEKDNSQSWLLQNFHRANKKQIFINEVDNLKYFSLENEEAIHWGKQCQQQKSLDHQIFRTTS